MTNTGAQSMTGSRGALRHYGDPAGEYRAAIEDAALFDRQDRKTLRVFGRAPGQMLQGILTNSAPSQPVELGDVFWKGETNYSLLLTPKGKVVTDLQVTWFGPTEEQGLLLDLPEAGFEGAMASFKRYLPPRMAKVEDASERIRHLTVAGPRGADALRGALQAVIQSPCPEEWLAGGAGSLESGGIVVSPSNELVGSVGDDPPVGPVAYHVWCSLDTAEQLTETLTANGVRPAGGSVYHALHAEAGRPLFGTDMIDSTIPIEAGLGEIAFDHNKGCYTGQEVIVRIRHRGRVNWHLRGLRFGESTPRIGQELFQAGEEKPIGRVTRFVPSPRYGETIGLGYVRREVEPPAVVQLGGPEGTDVGVAELPNLPLR